MAILAPKDMAAFVLQQQQRGEERAAVGASVRQAVRHAMHATNADLAAPAHRQWVQAVTDRLRDTHHCLNHGYPQPTRTTALIDWGVRELD